MGIFTVKIRKGRVKNVLINLERAIDFQNNISKNPFLRAATGGCPYSTITNLIIWKAI
ncbi:MAG: hypothetical protein HQK66_12225 [Desulfamplus sp.]|nr:hypothetical protein [Desulfamplus sp.]